MGYNRSRRPVLFSRQVVPFDPKNCGKTRNSGPMAPLILDFGFNVELKSEFGRRGTQEK
jgi:hypothetical protein